MNLFIRDRTPSGVADRETAAEGQSGPVPTLIFVRHGATDHNKHGDNAERIRGWSDVPLNTDGRAEAYRIAERIKEYPVSQIVCSDLERAETTALVIQQQCRPLTALISTAELRPWNLGDWAGRPVSEVLSDMLRMIKNEHEIPPHGESFHDFKDRVLIEYVHLFRAAVNAKNSGCIVVVTHTRNLRLLLAWMKAGGTGTWDINLEPMLTQEDPIHTGAVLLVSWNGQHWNIARDHLMKEDEYQRTKQLIGKSVEEVNKAGAAEPGYYDPEQIKIKREDEAAKQGEPGEIKDPAEGQPSYADNPDPGAEEEARQEEADKKAAKSLDKATGHPGGAITAAEVSPVDTNEDYKPRDDQQQQFHQPHEFHRPDHPIPFVQVGPIRGGENQHKRWSDVLHARVPMIGQPHLYLRQFKDPIEREHERSLIAKAQKEDAVAEGQRALALLPSLSEAELRKVAKQLWGEDHKYDADVSEDMMREDIRGAVEDLIETAS